MQEKILPPAATVEPWQAPLVAGQDASQGAGTSRRYISQQLLGNHTEVEILHGAAVYRLRLTSLGKLILTK